MVTMPKALSFVEFLLEDNGIHFFVTFRPARLPQPMMISNSLSEDIYYSQVRYKTRILVAANSTAFVAFEAPCSARDIVIHFGETVIKVDWTSSKCAEVDGRQIHINVITEKFQTIYVTSAPMICEPKADFVMRMKIPNVNISLIERYRREFLLFSMHHIETDYFRNCERETINLVVYSVQLDDLHPLAAHHVAMVGRECQGYRFLEFRCSYHRAGLSTQFHSISVRMQRLFFMVDIRFLSDFIHFVVPKKMATQEIVPPDTSSSVWLTIPVSVEKLTIHETAFIISSRTWTGRPSSAPLVDGKMRFLPNITNFQLSTPFQESKLDDINARARAARGAFRAIHEGDQKSMVEHDCQHRRAFKLVHNRTPGLRGEGAR
jgi:hypothetical protein